MNLMEQQHEGSKRDNLQELFGNLQLGGRVDCYVEQRSLGTTTEAGQEISYDCKSSMGDEFRVSDYADGSVVIVWWDGESSKSKRFDGARVQSDKDGIVITPIE